MGPGLDRIISRNHFIADWQNAKLFPSLMCQLTMTPDEGSSDGSAWTLPQTPVVWHATVVKSFMPSSIEEESGMVTLHVGEELTVYGCNPCDTTGIDPSARLVIETAEGVMGLARRQSLLLRLRERLGQSLMRFSALKRHRQGYLFANGCDEAVARGSGKRRCGNGVANCCRYCRSVRVL